MFLCNLVTNKGTKKRNRHDQQPNKQQNNHDQQPTQKKNGHSELHKELQTSLQKQSHKKMQQKRMQTMYCSPGTMSSFLNLRRTQKNATSQPATDGNENEGIEIAASRVSIEANENEGNENASVKEVHGNAVNEVHGNEANEVLEVEPPGKHTTAENSGLKRNLTKFCNYLFSFLYIFQYHILSLLAYCVQLQRRRAEVPQF